MRFEGEPTPNPHHPPPWSLFLHTVVPVLIHCLDVRHFERTNQPEAEPLRIGQIPNTLRHLRILHFPGAVGRHARPATRLHGRIVPGPATYGMRIRFSRLIPVSDC